MNKSVVIALCITAALLFWLASGIVFNESPEEQTESTAREKTLFNVRVREQHAEPVVREVVIHGRTAPARTVQIKAETQGRVESVTAKRGSPVSTGQVIAQIELRDREERLQQSQALLKLRQIEYEAAKDLAEKGYQSENRLAEAYANLEEARVQLKTISLDIKHTRIVAPFDGVLNERTIEVGDYVQNGDIIATFIELDPIIITGEVTELEVNKLEVGQRGHAELSSGDIIEGHIRYIAPAAQTASRTFTVEIEAPNPSPRIPSGITGQAYVAVETYYAHLVSPALLELNDKGELGIKIVDEQDIVHFLPANIVKNSGEGVWLSGLPDLARIITVGQGFVQDGEHVQVTAEPPNVPEEVTSLP